MCIRDWLCKLKVGRLLLSCDARPRMKSRYWLSCSRRGSPLRTSFGYRPLIGCNFDRSVWDKNWQDGEAGRKELLDAMAKVTLNEDLMQEASQAPLPADKSSSWTSEVGKEAGAGNRGEKSGEGGKKGH